MAKWLDRLESLAGGGPGGPKRIRTLRWLLLLGALGAGLIILNGFIHLQPAAPADGGLAAGTPSDGTAPALGRTEPESPFEAVERPLEQRLKEMLENVVGVGTVDVLVTVDSTEETVVERNETRSSQTTQERDRNGGSRSIVSETRDGQVVIYDSGDGQTPVVTKRIKPRIRGVLIVARGAENAVVRRLITEAVQRGLNVPASRISVVPRKQP